MSFSPLEKLLQEYKSVAYQDVWLNGQLQLRGPRECAYRHQILREFFQSFKRPVKVLDIGANAGYFSFRLAEEFPGCYVLSEGSQLEACLLRALMQKSDLRCFHLLAKTLTLADIAHLAQSEHFDVVLALSVVHHFSEPYQRVVDALCHLGSYVVVELPRPGEKLFQGARVDQEKVTMKRYKSRLLTKTFYTQDKSRAILRDMHLIDCGNKIFARTYCRSGQNMGCGIMTDCDFAHNDWYYLDFNSSQPAPAGLCLATYFALNGMYPLPSLLLQKLQQMVVDESDLVAPWNIYLDQGDVHHYASPYSLQGDGRQSVARIISSFQKAMETAREHTC